MMISAPDIASPRQEQRQRGQMGSGAHLRMSARAASVREEGGGLPERRATAVESCWRLLPAQALLPLITPGCMLLSLSSHAGRLKLPEASVA